MAPKIEDEKKLCIAENDIKEIIKHLKSALNPDVLFSFNIDLIKDRALEAKDKHILDIIEILKKQLWSAMVFNDE